MTAVTGDFQRDELPSGCDRVLLANVLHLESEAGARRLIGKAARACRAGGEVVVIDVFPVGARGPFVHAVYELHLAMRTAGRRAFRAGDRAGSRPLGSRSRRYCRWRTPHRGAWRRCARAFADASAAFELGERAREVRGRLDLETQPLGGRRMREAEHARVQRLTSELGADRP